MEKKVIILALVLIALMAGNASAQAGTKVPCTICGSPSGFACPTNFSFSTIYCSGSSSGRGYSRIYNGYNYSDVCSPAGTACCNFQANWPGLFGTVSGTTVTSGQNYYGDGGSTSTQNASLDISCPDFGGGGTCSKSFTIEWKAPTKYDDGSSLKESDIATYGVFRSSVSGGPYTSIATVNAPTKTYTDNSPESKTSCYAIKAIDNLGESSDYSSEQCVDCNGSGGGTCSLDCSAGNGCNLACATSLGCNADPDCGPPPLCTLDCSQNGFCNKDCLFQMNCPADPDCGTPIILTVKSSNELYGTTDPNGTKTVYANDKVDIFAIVVEGYKFDGWQTSSATDCPIDNATDATTKVTVKKDCTVTANFSLAVCSLGCGADNVCNDSCDITAGCSADPDCSCNKKIACTVLGIPGDNIWRIQSEKSGTLNANIAVRGMPSGDLSNYSVRIKNKPSFAGSSAISPTMSSVGGTCESGEAGFNVTASNAVAGTYPGLEVSIVSPQGEEISCSAPFDLIVSSEAVCTDGEVKDCGFESGACSFGIQTCSNGQWGICVGSVDPVPEVCGNNVDEDCDGAIDNGCACPVEGKTKQCGSTDAGVCEFGSQTCSSSVWSNCVGNIEPVPEICGNGLDEDCDGIIDGGNCNLTEICSNGIDDDGDGLIDSLDPDCGIGLKIPGPPENVKSVRG